jgi:Tfp pilus assembly protein FimV
MPFQYLTDLPLDRTTVLVTLLVVAAFMAAITMAVFRRRLASGRRRPRRAKAAARVHSMDSPADLHSTQSGETQPLSDFGSMVEVHRHLTPLTEAEVFMALGKDREAESLLLEAISRSPSNLNLRVKLAEVYAQRPDLEAFQSVAFKLRLITGARGQVWENIRTMGRHVDPGNPEYQNMEAAAQGTSAFAAQPHDSSDFAETVMSEAPVLKEIHWH